MRGAPWCPPHWTTQIWFSRITNYFRIGSQASILSLLANSSWMNFFWFAFAKKISWVCVNASCIGCHGELHERHFLEEWISKTTNWDVASNPFKEELWGEVRTKLNCFIKVCCYSVALLDCFNTSWCWAKFEYNMGKKNPRMFSFLAQCQWSWSTCKLTR